MLQGSLSCLQTMTMKKIRQQLNAIFGVDLSDRKDFLGAQVGTIYIVYILYNIWYIVICYSMSHHIKLLRYVIVVGYKVDTAPYFP